MVAADFVIEGKYSTWKEMVDNIRRNGEPDLQHTLNVLTLPGVPLRVVANDQLKADLFFGTTSRCRSSSTERLRWRRSSSPRAAEGA